MQYLSEQQIDKLASDTGEKLKKEKQVRLIIAPDNLGSHWEGGINGHFFRIRTGIELSLPESLAQLIAQNARVQMEGEAQLRAFKGQGKRIG